MSKFYKNSIGVSVIVDTSLDTAGATLELIVKKPDDTTVTWTGLAEELTKIKYVIQLGDWDQAGTYLLQAKITFADKILLGETVQFEVLEQFK